MICMIACGEVPAARIEVRDLGTLVIGGASSEPVRFDVPPDALSFLVSLRGDTASPNFGILLSRLDDPRGDARFDYQRDVHGDASALATAPIRTLGSLREPVYAISYPNTPALRMEPGTWGMRFVKDGDPGAFRATLFIKHGPERSTGALDLTIAIVSRNLTEHDIEPEIAALRDVFSRASIRLRRVDVRQLPGAFCAARSIIDTIDGPDSDATHLVADVARLLGATAGPTVVIVDEIRTDAGPGMIVLGKDGIIPGAPNLAGTAGGAVLVSAIDIGAPSGKIGRIAAHELGHHLGLFHVSERDGSRFDPIPDTPLCAGETQTACEENLMHWRYDDRCLVSPGQGFVLRRHPAVE